MERTSRLLSRRTRRAQRRSQHEDPSSTPRCRARRKAAAGGFRSLMSFPVEPCAMLCVLSVSARGQIWSSLHVNDSLGLLSILRASAREWGWLPLRDTFMSFMVKASEFLFRDAALGWIRTERSRRTALAYAGWPAQRAGDLRSNRASSERRDRPMQTADRHPVLGRRFHWTQ